MKRFYSVILCIVFLGSGSCATPSHLGKTTGAPGESAGSGERAMSTSEEQFVETTGTGFCSVDDWCWISTNTTGVRLWDVWSNPDVAYAVGEAGTLLKFDNDRWRQVKLDTRMDLTGIWGTGTKNIYVVGANAFVGNTIENGKVAEGEGVIYHFDGRKWSRVADGATTSSSWSDVWVSDAGDVYAVGPYGAVLHYDTHKWTFEDVETEKSLSAVFGSNDNRVMVVGNDNTVLTYDGAGWQSFGQTPTNNFDSWLSFYAAATLPSGALVAVGDNGAVYTPEGEIHSWVSNEEGVEVGVRSATLHMGKLYVMDSELYRFDEANGQWVNESWPGPSMRAVHGDASGRMVAVGDYGAIWQKSGERAPWTATQDVSPLPARDGCSGLMTSDSNELYVEFSDKIYRFSAVENDWVPVDIHSDATNGDGWFYRSEYFSWDEDQERWPLTQFAKNGEDGGLLAVGTMMRFQHPERGIIMRLEENKWVEMAIPSTQYLKSIWCQRKDDCWAVGARGIILHYNGENWTDVSQEVGVDIHTSELRTVHGDKKASVYIGGMGGVLLENRNGAWIHHTLPGASNIDELLVLAQDNVYAATSNGWIAHYDGILWTIEDSGTSEYLSHIESMDDGRTVVVCGANGILKKRLKH